MCFLNVLGFFSTFSNIVISDIIKTKKKFKLGSWNYYDICEKLRTSVKTSELSKNIINLKIL